MLLRDKLDEEIGVRQQGLAPGEFVRQRNT